MLAKDLKENLYEELVDALRAIAGDFPEYRPVHAKGIMCSGTFTAGIQAREITRAIHMQGQPVPTVIRFSNASGDPHVADGERNGRGMAVAFKLPGGGTTDIVAQSTMGFVARTPEEFLNFLHAAMADAKAGGSQEQIKAFLATHPRSSGFVERLTSESVPTSYATIPYYAVNAFGFRNASGENRFGRYRFIPEAEVAYLSAEEAAKKDADFLERELAQRLDRHHAFFKLMLQVAHPEDITDDATVLWPEERTVLELGRLEIKAASRTSDSDQQDMAFDPGRLVDGIELSEDPILRVRPEIYAISFSRRSKTA